MLSRRALIAGLFSLPFIGRLFASEAEPGVLGLTGSSRLMGERIVYGPDLADIPKEQSMSTISLRFEAASSEWATMLAELTGLLEDLVDIPPEIAELLVGIRADGRSTFDINTSTAGGTVTVSIKPSQRLRDLVAAVRAHK